MKRQHGDTVKENLVASYSSDKGKCLLAGSSQPCEKALLARVLRGRSYVRRWHTRYKWGHPPGALLLKPCKFAVQPG